MIVSEFEKWRDQLPRCVGYTGGCDGDLVGLPHEENCPARGNQPVTLKDAWDAAIASQSSKLDSLRQQLAECRDETLVEAAKAMCDPCKEYGEPTITDSMPYVHKTTKSFCLCKASRIHRLRQVKAGKEPL